MTCGERAFLCSVSSAPLGLRFFKSVRGMSQNVRISLFGGNCHVSPLCFIPLVRHDEGLKTRPPELSLPPQPLAGTHGLMVLGFCFQKQPEENYCSISVSLVHHFPKCFGCK